MDLLAEKIGSNFSFTFILIYGTLVWVRMLAIAAVIPFILGKPVPNTIRVGASFVIALFFFTHTVPHPPPALPEDYLFLFSLYLKEIFIGLTIGLSAGMVFYGFEAAGQMIDNQRGVSIARLLIPQLGTQGSLSGSFLFQMSIVLYLSIGGHQYFLDAVGRSYQLFPVLTFPHIGEGMLPMIDLFVQMGAEVVMMSVQIAAPVIIAILLADIILGVANRIAPQINVWEMGFNVKGYLGILILFLSLGAVAGQMAESTRQSGRYVDRMINYMQGLVPEEERHPEDEIWEMFRNIPGTPEKVEQPEPHPTSP